MSEISQNRSSLKDFLASIATIPGDLSNITAPPFVLAPHSAVEFPAYWAEHPSVFVAPASEPDPARRTLLVLKWFLSSLKQQQYGGRDEKEGVKKPLNAFLGELFVARWEGGDGKEKGEGIGETRLVSEQVSHHPPVTACYLWNDNMGIRASGATAQSVTLSGPSLTHGPSIHVSQTGHAILHIDRFSEDYLIPMPSVKVSGILSGTPSPELQGTYYIPGSSGFIGEIDFSPSSSSGGGGSVKKWFRGGTKSSASGTSNDKNAFSAQVYRVDDPKKEALYTIDGTWTESFTIHDVQKDQELETYSIISPPAQAPSIQLPPLEKSSPWESRRAWSGVTSALAKGNMKGVSEEKHKLEEGQREMRRKEEKEGRKWKQVFFFDEAEKGTGNGEERVRGLKKVVGRVEEGKGDWEKAWREEKEKMRGVWRVDEERVRKVVVEGGEGGLAGLHGGLTPTG